MPEAAPATTEEQIVRAAVRLFAERGFHATGIRQLAEQAGINSSTLYHYMGTKEDLLFRIVQDSSKRLIEAARQLTARELDPPAAICGLVQIHVWSHATYSAETAVVDNELRALDKPRREAAVRLRDRYEAFWSKTVEAGCARGDFRVPDRRIARLGILQMCSGVAQWYSPSGKLSLRDLVAAHAQMVLGALGASRDRDQVRTLLLEADAQPIADRVWSQP
ncbi:TetR/AcrR family transcriptional regulator [Fodinicola feengrottensis]|uniref:TetR/AcrR family transcriptional regulator n=1 Tax=Fodinicola feengrottensis TaxID=435914 RepID=UPI0031DF46D2